MFLTVFIKVSTSKRIKEKVSENQRNPKHVVSLGSYADLHKQVQIVEVLMKIFYNYFILSHSIYNNICTADGYTVPRQGSFFFLCLIVHLR